MGRARQRLAAAVVVGALVGLAGGACSGDGEPASEDARSGGLDRALIAAAASGATAEVQELLDRGASVDAVDGNGRTALVAASYGGHVATARALIEAGADVNRQDDSRQSAYHIATSEIGPDAGLELLRLTLAHGADVRSLDRYSGTGLIRAAHRGYAGIVAELLRTDIAVDHVNGLGWTALLEAIILGQGGPEHTRVVALLLEAGANPDRPDGDGVTPLAHAEARGFSEIAAHLRAAGATSA